MGVYIPPPRGDDDKNKTTSKPASNSSDSSSDSDIIIIKIPNNPSLGLFTGPFTPAADNLPALYGVTGLQLLLGLWCFRKARRVIKPIQTPNSMIPNKRGTWFEAAVPTVLGTMLIGGAGLELGRFTLSYDPWYEEAKYYRRLAKKNGIKVSSWFGAYKYYNPIDQNTWSDKVIDNLKMASETMEEKKIKQKIKPSILTQLNKKAKYIDIYNKLYESNKIRYLELLENELADANESNMHARMAKINANPEYGKPQIQLAGESIESDDEFEVAWTAFDPWDELIPESYSDMRMIPIFVLDFDNHIEINDLKEKLAEKTG